MCRGAARLGHLLVAIFAGRMMDGGKAGTIEIRYTYIVRPAPVLGTGDHDQPQKAMRDLNLSGGDDESGTALSNRPVGVWERNLDDVPYVKDRHTRAGRPRTTIRGM